MDHHLIKTRNKNNHVNTLIYLVAPLENNSLWFISIEFQEDANINIPITQVRDMYINSCIFISKLPSQVFSVNMVMIKKIISEAKEAKIIEEEVEATQYDTNALSPPLQMSKSYQTLVK